MPPLDYIPVRTNVVQIRAEGTVEKNNDQVLIIPERREAHPDLARARVRLVRLRTDTTPDNVVLVTLLDELRLRLWAGLEAGAFRLD